MPDTKEIADVHIFTIVDPQTGEEGIAGLVTPQGGRPLIAVNDDILKEVLPLAQEVANICRLPVHHLKFETRTYVDDVLPQADAEPSERLTEVPEGDPAYTPQLSDFTEPEKSEK
ncbi:MAG: hypothetical protein DRJ03_01885 [Chloroflexi bacterium]|nr:MAG: hypothetical protein DRJ03_01885 [Chloroflexota bacterium]